MLNDIHVYGRRVEPFGVENYPEEILKIRQMTALRDARVHELARGAAAAPVDDAAQTLMLTEIETNFNLPIEFLDVQRAIDRSSSFPKDSKSTCSHPSPSFPNCAIPLRCRSTTAAVSGLRSRRRTPIGAPATTNPTTSS